ncbi:MAG: tRNA (adenosine(37)-N6)-threonylcarbamoyltransferase complex ATPase subunit type 1 TsaE [Caldimicrobium sp.]
MEIISKSPEETRKIGHRLAKILKPGDLVLFYGDLGSGKTTLIQGICEGLEVRKDQYITSPTFTLLNFYEGIYPILHIDLYRIDPSTTYELSIWEYLSSHILLVEWAEKLNEIPVNDYLEIQLEYIEESMRKITFVGYGEWSQLLKELGKDEKSHR